MILAGDVAIANGDRFTFHQFPTEVRAKPWCINLEGAIADPAQMLDWGVYNASDWCESLADFNLGPVFLGNNHVHDLPSGVTTTLTELRLAGIQGFGAGNNEPEAVRPALVSSGDRDYVLGGFGWPVVGCRPASTHQAGINRLEAQHALRTVATLLEQYPDRQLVVVLHWNYECERYPQPGHRKLAMDLIDRGVYAVVGHHPHIVGPVERYRGRTIAYSLGNWAFSYGRYFGGRLKLPASSFHQIAVELSEEGNLVHHAQFAPPSTVCYQGAERVDADDFSLRPAFEDFSHAEYLHWFKANRVKRKGLPVYVDAADSPANRLRDRWVGFRQVLIDYAAKSGLKAMRRRG